MTDINTLKRFWNNIEWDIPSGCWIWTGYLQTKGYGQFMVEGKYMLAHRFAWELFRGPLDPEITIDHYRWLCPKTCCNPAHLEPVSRSENSRRQMERRGIITANLKLQSELGLDGMRRTATL